MPRYPFQCERCGLAFEVSRPMSEASAEAHCPVDGDPAVRVFEAPAMNFHRPAPASPRAAQGSGFSHHGHRHGPGTSAHSHGPSPGPASQP